jgi:hypothetical protein
MLQIQKFDKHLVEEFLKSRSPNRYFVGENVYKKMFSVVQIIFHVLVFQSLW